MERWSRKDGRCKQCGTTDRKHYGHGLCKKCYYKIYEKNRPPRNRPEYNSMSAKRWRKRIFINSNKGKHLMLNPICLACSDKKALVPHHKDGNSSNNDPKNFITLCRKCHTRLHNFLRLEKFFGDKLEILKGI